MSKMRRVTSGGGLTGRCHPCPTLLKLISICRRISARNPARLTLFFPVPIVLVDGCRSGGRW